MSGRIGLREEARAGHLLARQIAGLFALGRQPLRSTVMKPLSAPGEVVSKPGEHAFHRLA